MALDAVGEVERVVAAAPDINSGYSVNFTPRAALDEGNPIKETVMKLWRLGIPVALAALAIVAGCGTWRSMGAPCEAERAAVGLVGADPEPTAHDTEEYAHVVDNPFLRTAEAPLSTFAVDVDTASYANVRRILNEGRRPPAGAVRIEEMVNYFRYRYPQPAAGWPFAASAEVGAAPWAPSHRLLRIALQGREISLADAPAANLVFLVDVSGSMAMEGKLPLVKDCLRLLVERLRGQDRVAMVVYAGTSGLALPSTDGGGKEAVLGAIERLEAGGSTNGGEGIRLAYQVAAKNFIRGGINRVVLCTDGDFNVGVTSESELVRLIERERESGVFLSVLGFGAGNYADARMQELADRGNGNASYIDTLNEGRRVLVEQATGTLLTIAKDVKIQVEFNPARVAGYRLIGYENRLLAAQDFNDDRKDAGEIGAGHQVTALYEIVPAGQEVPAGSVDPLKYQTPTVPSAPVSGDLCTVKLRWKQPEGDTSAVADFPVPDPGLGAAPSDDFDFAAAVAAFGMLLRESPHRGQAGWDLVLELARGGLGDDVDGRRAEFVELVRKAKGLAK